MSAKQEPRIRARTRVRVPASTSNLGPGFDVLGLALHLHNEVECELLPHPGPIQVDIEGEGELDLPRDAANIAVRAAAQRHPFGAANSVRFRFTNRIPLARGLGSSAAARLGGMLAMRALFPGWEKDVEPTMWEACRLEGHPDNVVASFFGGLCAVMPDGDRHHVAHIHVPRDLGAVVCIPNFELATAKARAVLPNRVSLGDAVKTASRVAFVLSAIEQRRYGWLKTAMLDVLHQPYRRPLVPGLYRVIDAALKAGAWGAALSGAGPSVFAFVPRGPRGAVIGRAMQKAFLGSRVESRYQVLDIDRRGVSIERLE
ncbi:MAG: homoserine kinase [Proteobacteria bacterium]|nr:homoserine kinase [Pseudomonadota bacterium]